MLHSHYKLGLLGTDEVSLVATRPGIKGGLVGPQFADLRLAFTRKKYRLLHFKQSYHYLQVRVADVKRLVIFRFSSRLASLCPFKIYEILYPPLISFLYRVWLPPKIHTFEIANPSFVCFRHRRSRLCETPLSDHFIDHVLFSHHENDSLNPNTSKISDCQVL